MSLNVRSTPRPETDAEERRPAGAATGAPPDAPGRPKRGRSWKRWAIGGVAALLVLAALAAGLFWAWMSQPPPADLDLSTTRLSAQGVYRVSITPSAQPIPINRVHTWTLHVETPDGQPVNDAAITVDGDMPQHGHGLPTRPEVTRNLGNGDYLVEGMKFQMGGWWVVDFAVTAAGQSDTVRFNLILDQ